MAQHHDTCQNDSPFHRFLTLCQHISYNYAEFNSHKKNFVEATVGKNIRTFKTDQEAAQPMDSVVTCSYGQMSGQDSHSRILTQCGLPKVSIYYPYQNSIPD